MTKPPKYRENAGMCLLNRKGQIFIAQRTGFTGDEGWQMPQGGIDAGEQPLVAASRELHEETSIDVSMWQFLGTYPEVLTYDLPAKVQQAEGFLGQEQRWFYAVFTGKEAEIDVLGAETPEFDEWRWADAKEVLRLCVPFKANVYTKVLEHLQSSILPEAMKRGYFKQIINT